MVLAVVRTGGASGGRGSLIKDILNGAESAVEIKAPSVPLSIMLGLRHCMIQTHRRVAWWNILIQSFNPIECKPDHYLFLQFGDFSTENMMHL